MAPRPRPRSSSAALQYLRVEGATHSLLIEAPGGDLVAPLIVTEIEGTELRDAVSPYGYPGIVPRGPTPEDRAAGHEIDWSATGLVSAFVRGTATRAARAPGHRARTASALGPGA